VKLKFFPSVDWDFLERLKQEAEEKAASICHEVNSLESTISEYTRAKRSAAERQKRRSGDRG